MTHSAKVLAFAIALGVPALAAAAPADEKVVSGSATFTREGSLTLITTSTPQTVVNYSSFDIGRTEAVRIDQPSATSQIVNNVLSTNPTQIDGMLTSNGQVFIVNPVGVFFGDHAIVDVGRLVAAAGTVDPAELLSGTERFSQLTGRVEVGAGAQIRAADSVLLVGAAVANYGNISAADGMVALVAGGEVRLARVDGRVIVTADRAIAPDPNLWGVVQAGEIDAGKGGVSLTAGDAYSLAINHTGITRARDIAVAGGDGVVSVSGALDASDRSAGATGGAITVTGDRIALLGAQLDASGSAGGGSIRVGGDVHGEGELPNAKRTYVDANSTLRADAIETGDGGKVIVWSDEATRFYGKLSARGGAAGGDGGFAEISGASLDARGSVDLSASAGKVGTLLYDPKDIVLHAGTLDGTDAPDTSDAQLSNGQDSIGLVLFGTPDEATTPFDVYESELEGTQANIVLEATNSISSPDTFTANLGTHSLTMTTRNNAGDETGTTFAPGIDLANVSFTTIGGTLSLTTGNGGISVADLTTTGATGAAGSNGGTVAITANGTGLEPRSVSVGNIVTRGGDGTAGAGGNGGDVSISAKNGSVTVANIDASGGDGTISGSGSLSASGGAGGDIKLIADLDEAPATPDSIVRDVHVNGDLIARGGNSTGDADDAGALGGSGGSIGVSAGVTAGAGKVVIGAVTLDASAGDGTAGGGNACSSAVAACTAGPIRIEARDDVTATGVTLRANGGTTTAGGPGGAGGNAGPISVASAAGDVTFSGGLESIGGTGLPTATVTTPVNGTAGAASLQAHGTLTATIDAANVADVEVVETDVEGAVHVSGAAGYQAEGGGTTATTHTITSIDTRSAPTHFTYRLADAGDGTAPQVDVTTLAVGGATFGAHGGTIANSLADTTAAGGERLLGGIDGFGSAPNITLNGGANLQLLATNIGTGQPLTVSGPSDSAIEATVAGDVQLGVGGSVGLVELDQRRAAGHVNIDLPGGGTGEVQIDGNVIDNGSSRLQETTVTRVDTTASNTKFFFALSDTTASTDVPNSGEPALTIESGAVTLGADARFSAAGNVVLEGGVDPAIDANLHGVALVADTNHNAVGAVVGSGTTDVVDASNLMLIGEGIGTEATPLHTSTSGTTLLAGKSGGGDFRVTNAAGTLAVGGITNNLVVHGTATPEEVSGITAGGAVKLDNGVRDIVLAQTIQPADQALLAHVTSVGDQDYVGNVLIDNLATFRTNPADDTTGVTKNTASLVSTGGVVRFHGDIGTDPGASEAGSLAVTDAEFTAGNHTVTLASGDFRRIDGPGSLVMRGVGAGSQFVIRDDVGGRTPLALFDADADLLVLGSRTSGADVVSSADLIAAGDVRLNTANPSTSPFATIADTSGGLRIASTGDVSIGAGEKLSSTGRLEIDAAGTARLADLSASEIDVNASQIQIQTRAPGPVALPDGSSVTDFGVDWAANDILTNVVPTQLGAGPAPTFVLGSGGIETGGPVPFDVVRFTKGNDAIKTADFSANGRVLDLAGRGPRAISDASKDVPAAAPPVLPGLAARKGEEPPTPPRTVSSEEVMGALHCRTASGDACTPPAPGDDPLTTERAREIVARYRALVGSDAGRQNLAASFAPFAAMGAEPDALPHALASHSELSAARSRIGELAVTLTQVELLGLDPQQSAGVRHAIADEFAGASGVAGLTGDTVLAAVDASGVAVLPN